MEHVTQRRISAAGAPPAAAPGAVSSPFSMAGQYMASRQGTADAGAGEPNAPAEGGQKNDQVAAAPVSGGVHLRPRARKVLESCGPLTEVQLAEGLGESDMKKVRRMIANAVHTGEFERATDGEGREVIQLKPRTPPKRFLAKKGAAGKAAPAKSKKVSRRKNRGGSARAGKAPSLKAVKRARFQPTKKVRELPAQVQRSLGDLPAPTSALVAQADTDDFRCGLFSDGSLEIYADGKSERYSRDRVRKLVAYLDKIAGATVE